MTKIVGLDLSLTSTGVAVVQAGSVSVHRVTPPVRLSRHERLQRLYTEVRQLSYGADYLVVESGFNATSGTQQHSSGGMWWLVMHVLWLDNPDAIVVKVIPQHIKIYATGKGICEKDEVLAAVIRRYPDIPVGNNDEADAFVLLAMCCDQLGYPLAELPVSHRRALAAWPYDVPAKKAKKNASKEQ